MKILMVLSDSHYPDDIRVRKEVRALSNKGHRVSVLAYK